LKKNKLYIFLYISLFSCLLTGNIDTYLYKNTYPSHSVWGTTGLVSMPNARFHESGVISMNFSSHEPYQRLAVIAYPFEWFEAIYQYTDIRDRLYSPVFAFSGNQTFKDKGFDIKIRILNESRFLPATAIGLRDIAGTGLFSAEYLAMSKRYRNLDITLGLGWGSYSNNRIENPLGKIISRFNGERGIFTGDNSKGGELSTASWFRGEKAGLFGGVEYYSSKFKGLRAKIEYDSTNYLIEGNRPQKKDSSINFGVIYNFSDNFSISLGRVRGNTFQFGFNIKNSFGRKSNIVRKNIPKKIDRSAAIKEAGKISERYAYLASLKYLSDENINLRSATISGDEFEVAYSQPRFTSYPQSYGRILNTLDQILPEEIHKFTLIPKNRTFYLSSLSIDRASFRSAMKQSDFNYILDIASIEDGYQKDKAHKYNPERNYPKTLWSISPDYSTHIGGADRFFAGSLVAAINSETIIMESLNFEFRGNVGIASTFDVLQQGSDSLLPHVRTDVIEYLKKGDKYNIQRAQFNYFNQLSPSIYTKLSAGIFESMYSGIGGEVLYRRFDSNFAIGANAYHVKKRDFNQMFDLLDYQTNTGHITLYFQEPFSNILVKIIGGRYLAEDSGITLDLSRRFKSGLQMGVFATRTDISKEEFGEGSFDKGFYFFMPIDVFSRNYSRKLSGFGMTPLTRDGGQRLYPGYELYGVTDEANIYNVLFTKDDFFK